MLQDEKVKRLDADQIKAAAYATDNAKLLAQLYENGWIGDPDEDDLVKIAGANAENILRYLSDRGYDFEKNTEASTDALIEANYMGYSHIFRLYWNTERCLQKKFCWIYVLSRMPLRI